jgi:hypothetical protein
MSQEAESPSGAEDCRGKMLTINQPSPIGFGGLVRNQVVNKEIIMQNNPTVDKQNLCVYDEPRIDFDPTEEEWGEGVQQTASDIEKRVVVQNGSQPVSECQVILEELAYHFREEWTDPPNGYEQKALQWADGRGTQDGRIAIPAQGSAKLSLMRMFRYPNPFFGITYADGSLGKTHHFSGAYRLRLRLEGKIGDKTTSRVFRPCSYEIYLLYGGALELEIEEIVRVRTN